MREMGPRARGAAVDVAGIGQRLRRAPRSGSVADLLRRDVAEDLRPSWRGPAGPRVPAGDVDALLHVVAEPGPVKARRMLQCVRVPFRDRPGLGDHRVSMVVQAWRIALAARRWPGRRHRRRRRVVEPGPAV